MNFKKIISIVLSLLMVVSMMPASIFAEAKEAPQARASMRNTYVTIERYDSENDRLILEPVKVKRSTSVETDALFILKKAISENESKLLVNGVCEDQIMGFTDHYIKTVVGINATETHKWFASANNVYGITAYNDIGTSIKDNTVYRFIYTNKDNKMLGNGDNLSSETAVLTVNKDELVVQIAEANEKYPGGNIFIDKAKECLVDENATEEEIAKNVTILKNLIEGVLPEAESLVIENKDNLNVKIGGSINLTAKFIPEGTVGNAEWSVDNTKIATIDKTTGTLKGISEGDVTVTAKLAGKSFTDTAIVHVKKVPATSVTINESNPSVVIGQKTQLTATVLPADSTDKVVWTSKNPAIAKVDATGTVTGLELGAAKIEAKAGNKTTTVEINVIESQEPYIYFEHSNGKKTLVDSKTNSISLSLIDEGTFKVANFDGNVEWSCEREVQEDTLNSTKYIVKSNGKFDPFKVSQDKVNVTFNPYTEDELIQSFTLKTEASGIEELRAKINGEVYSPDKAFSTVGASTATVNVEGRKTGTEEFVNIPLTALHFTSSDKGSVDANRQLDGRLELKQGAAVITIALEEDNSPSTHFTAVVGDVHVEDMKVNVPEVYNIDKWNFLGGYYVGIMPHTGYTIQFTPANVTNKGVRWEALTPEIATHMDAFDNGIIPKKNGVAKFRVTSMDNPDISKIVQVKFQFKTPLENVTLKTTDYVMEAGNTILLKPSYTPAAPTEERFTWKMESSDGGKIQINESVSGDGDYKFFKHEITALKPGTVNVVGTPIDDTNKNIKPIEFTVKVKSGNSVTTEVKGLDNSIKYGMKNMYKPGSMKYGEEWGIFALARAGKNFTEKEKAQYVESLEKTAGNGERLDPASNARIVLALTAMGMDPREVVKNADYVANLYNLKDLSTDHHKFTSNMLIWALNAFDSHNYEIPVFAENTRESLVKGLLDYQMSNGGFNLYIGKDATLGDPMLDITAMAIQALANYKDQPEVKKAIDHGIEYINERITGNAGFINEGDENSCTSAQVIVALSKLGINYLNTDSGFVRNGKNIINRIQEFKTEGGYALFNGGKADGMSTTQVTYALTAHKRFISGENALFDLTDIKLSTEKPVAPEVKPEVDKETGNVVIVDKTGADVEFNPGVIKNAENKLIIKVANGKVVYDKAAVEAIRKQLPKDTVKIRFEIKPANRFTENLTEPQNRVIKKNKNASLYKVTLIAERKNGSEVEIKDFGKGTAKITISYENRGNKKLQVVRVEKNGTLTIVKNSYKNGELTWLTHGHSYYMVAEKGTLKGNLEVEKPVYNGGTSADNENIGNNNNNNNNNNDVNNNVGNESPKTGDETNIYGWIMLLVAAAFAFPAIRRRFNR